MRSLRTASAAVLTFCTASGMTTAASAQVGGSFGWNPTTGPQTTTFGLPSPTQSAPTGPQSGASSDFEIGTLYVASAAYGANMGVWIDAEAGISDPGLRFIAPGVLGVAGPIGVYLLDQPDHMRRGVPAAITAGLSIGAGEGIGIWSYQFVTSNTNDAWGFRGFMRSTFIGSTVGGVGGAVVGFTQEPSPKTSLLLGSSVVWGAAIGSMFGYGISGVGEGYGLANDAASRGGLIGYNLGLLGAAGLSAVWVPTYKQIAWMWIGAGAGFAVTLPVYLFYAGASDDHPAKRGLAVQAVGTTLGILAGGLLTMYDTDDIAAADPFQGPRPAFAQITGVSVMPVPGGGGAQLTGLLF